MTNIENNDKLFKKANQYEKHFEFKKAIECYQILLNSSESHKNAFYKLVRSLIRNSNFKLARKYLENEDNDTIKISNYLYGLLEAKENNFLQSKKYLLKSLEYPNTDIQKEALLDLGNIEFQLGNYDIAEKIYETVCMFPDYEEKAKVKIIILNYYLGEYHQAKKLIQKMITNNIKFESNAILLYIINEFCDKQLNEIYSSELVRSYNTEKEQILKHVICKHCTINDSSRFFKYIDIEKIFNEVKDNISEMNGNYSKFSELYYIHMDDAVGVINDEIVSDLCLVTRPGDLGIITSFPISLSSKFDSDNLTYSKELKLKRKKGRISND